MKRLPFAVIFAGLVAGSLLTACDTTNEYEVYTSNDCLISAVTLGSIPRTIHTLSSTGADSTYEVSVTGSLYPMYIDQLNNRVYNADSLPKGTQQDKIVFSAFNTSGSVMAIRSLTSDNDTTFVRTDSTDFTSPRIITVYSSDNTMSRSYEVKVNVHQEEGDSMNWSKMAEGNATVAAWEKSRTLAVGTALYFYGRRPDGRTELIRTSADAPSLADAPVQVGASTGQELDIRSIHYFKGTFVSLASGEVVASADGAQTYAPTGASLTFESIAAQSTDSLYAIAGDALYASADARSWTRCATDTENRLPTADAAGCIIPSPIQDTYESVVMTGTRAGESVVWKRDIDRGGEHSFAWTFLPQTEELGEYACPALTHTSLLAYDGSSLLIGMNADGTAADFYLSGDNGRTWKTGEIKAPSLSGATALSAAVDANQHIWVVCSGTGDVWRGRLNRLGWEVNQTVFDRSRRQ